MAFDANSQTYWLASANKHQIALDLGREYHLTGFIYTPPQQFADGMMEKSDIQISNDGKNWQTVENVAFGNLVNDPTPRTHYFTKMLTTRYVRVQATSIAANKKNLAIAELDFLEK